MIKNLDESTAIYPYTYLPAKAVRVRSINESGETVTMTKWYDLDTGKELPPYYGYGKKANKLIKKWYEDNTIINGEVNELD